MKITPKTSSLSPEDAEDIAQIAATSEGFTVPSSYIIWMLAISGGRLCRVLRDAENGLEGYLLALLCDDQKHAFVWQVAISVSGFKRKSEVHKILIKDFVRQAIELGVKTVYFTTQPRKITFFNRHLTDLGCSPAQLVSTPFYEKFAVPTPGEKFYFTELPQGMAITAMDN